jgi:hypothetical protein
MSMSDENHFGSASENRFSRCCFSAAARLEVVPFLICGTLKSKAEDRVETLLATSCQRRRRCRQRRSKLRLYDRESASAAHGQTCYA